MIQPRSWQSYEEVARYLLNRIASEFGLDRVEGKQSIAGQASGTSWEIDAKGVASDGVGFVIIEARRYPRTRLSQEQVAAIAYRIQDTGAAGGIVVSPLPLQAGAAKVAKSAGVIHVQLDAASNTERYILKFLNNVMIGLSPDAISVTATVLGGTLTSVVTYPGDQASDA